MFNNPEILNLAEDFHDVLIQLVHPGWKLVPATQPYKDFQLEAVEELICPA